MSCDCLDSATGQPCPEEVTASCFSCKKSVCSFHTCHDNENRTYCPDCALAEGVATCREKVGFLTVKDCAEKASAKCTSCQCPLCTEHAVATPRGVLCAFCAEKLETSPEDGKSYQRQSYGKYYHSGYKPHYWGKDKRYKQKHKTSSKSYNSHYNESDTYIFEEHRSKTHAEGVDVERDDGDFES